MGTRQRTVDTPSVTLTGLTNCTEYTLRVRASNAEGDSDWSEEAAGTPQVSAPERPGPPDVTPGDGTLQLTWPAVVLSRQLHRAVEVRGAGVLRDASADRRPAPGLAQRADQTTPSSRCASGRSTPAATATGPRRRREPSMTPAPADAAGGRRQGLGLNAGATRPSACGPECRGLVRQWGGRCVCPAPDEACTRAARSARFPTRRRRDPLVHKPSSIRTATRSGFRIDEDAVSGMPAETFAGCGRRLVDALIVWVMPDHQLRARRGPGLRSPATRGSNGCGGEDGHHPRPDPPRRGRARAPGADRAPPRGGLHQPEHPPRTGQRRHWTSTSRRPSSRSRRRRSSRAWSRRGTG